MMRKMRQDCDDGETITVVEHIITRNFWEFYITDEVPVADSADIKFALVMGHETELGDVSLDEIRPYIITRTTQLQDVAPAPGWTWVDT